MRGAKYVQIVRETIIYRHYRQKISQND